MRIEGRLFQHHAGERGFVTRRIAGETIVVPVSSQVGDLDSVYTFNDAGSRVWSMLERPVSIATIAAALAEEFDAPEEQIAGDVAELIQALQERGLVSEVEGIDA